MIYTLYKRPKTPEGRGKGVPLARTELPLPLEVRHLRSSDFKLLWSEGNLSISVARVRIPIGPSEERDTVITRMQDPTTGRLKGDIDDSNFNDEVVDIGFFPNIGGELIAEILRRRNGWEDSGI